LPPFWRRKVFHPFVHFFYGCGTRIGFLLAHLLPPLRFVCDCHTERRFAARQCRRSVGSLPFFQRCFAMERSKFRRSRAPCFRWCGSPPAGTAGRDRGTLLRPGLPTPARRSRRPGSIARPRVVELGPRRPTGRQSHHGAVIGRAVIGMSGCRSRSIVTLASAVDARQAAVRQVWDRSGDGPRVARGVLSRKSARPAVREVPGPAGLGIQVPEAV
jgi:hypothetical protein